MPRSFFGRLSESSPRWSDIPRGRLVCRRLRNLGAYDSSNRDKECASLRCHIPPQLPELATARPGWLVPPVSPPSRDRSPCQSHSRCGLHIFLQARHRDPWRPARRLRSATKALLNSIAKTAVSSAKHQCEISRRFGSPTSPLAAQHEADDTGSTRNCRERLDSNPRPPA